MSDLYEWVDLRVGGLESQELCYNSLMKDSFNPVIRLILSL